MKNIDKRDWITFFCLMAVAIIAEILFFDKHGNPFVDIGREFYISQRVSEGAVLYKDLFNIYGPLAYQLNAILFKCFGVNMLVLCLFGNFIGLGIVGAVYVLARQYLTRFYAVIIALFAIFNGICRTVNFNFIVPYSFGLTYGALAILISLILLVRYIKSPEMEKNLYISAIFAGAAVLFKYDYFPYLLIYGYVIWSLRLYDWKKLLKLALSFLVVPFLSLFPLFLNGLDFSHISQTAILMKKIATAPSLFYFYKAGGVFLTKDLIAKSFVNLAGYLVVFAGLYKVLCLAEKNKNVYWTITILFTVIFTVLSFYISFIEKFLPLAVVLTAILFVKFKEFDKSDCLLVVAAIVVSLKTFFNSGIQYYCLMPSIFLVMAFIVVLKNYLIKNEKVFKTMLVMVLLILFVSQMVAEVLSFVKYQGNIKTERGFVTAGALKSPEAVLIDVLQKITSSNDKIVILPEGHIINFLINRRSDDMYNNFIPMYVEAFGEKDIINHYVHNKPDYFVMSTRPTLEYGKEFICKDYAKDLCDWIFYNYTLLYKIAGEPEYYILRKNK